MPLVDDKGALEIMIERLKACFHLDWIVVATTDQKQDDPIEALCRKLYVPCFRGSEDDVLDRYYQAAKLHNAKNVVRLTGDCPLQHSHVVDDLIEAFCKEGCDYMANALHPTYPDGFDAEVMTFDALTTCWQEAKKTSEREHVTPYIHAHPEEFLIESYSYDRDVSHLRLTLDEEADRQVIQSILEALYPNNHYFTLEDVLTFVDQHPELLVNSDIMRNEGYQKSLEKDKNVQ